jgi:glycosyltransferase involved in cell wall biosynthesis
MIFYSVIMSAYNAEKYVKQAIQSILGQTYTHFEFLICNDGSQDNTLQILESFNDPRITIINNEVNKGLTKSLNILLDLSNGEYIIRQDADDFSREDRLEKINIELIKHSNSFIFSNYQKIDQSGESITISDLLNIDIYKSLFSGTNPLCHGSICFPNNPEIRYNERFRYSQDYLFYLENIHNLKILFISEPLYFLRFSGDSVSFTKSLGQLYVKFYVFFIYFKRNYKIKFLYSILRKTYYTLFILMNSSTRVNKRRTKNI